VSKTKQADGEIHEDQLLNFLVNRLDEEVSFSLANNAEITAEDIYEVLVGACADEDLGRVGGRPPPTATASVDPSVILSSRPSVQPLRHRTQAAETASRGCFVRY